MIDIEPSSAEEYKSLKEFIELIIDRSFTLSAGKSLFKEKILTSLKVIIK